MKFFSFGHSNSIGLCFFINRHKVRELMILSSMHAELSIHKKSSVLQKTEDKQVKSLVERKGAFTAEGHRMTLGFRLMGLKATIQAQVAQIEQEKAATKKTAKKKADKMKLKVEKVDESFCLWKSGAKVPLDAWWDIIWFLLPLYDSNTASSTLNTIKKATEKLQTFETAYGSKWDEFMEMHLQKFQLKQSANTESSNPTWDLWSQLHLESNDDSDSIDIHEEAGV